MPIIAVRPHKTTLADDSASFPLNRAQLKAQKLYQSCMDEETLQKLGMTPMLEFLSSIGGWLLTNTTDDRSAESLETTLLNLFRSGYYPIVWVGVALDEKDTSRHVIMVSPCGTSLTLTRSSID
jgi:predicted metalloendopeptidase